MALEHIERRAARMRQRRDELGLTQEEVADRMQDIHAERSPDEPRDRTRGQMVSDWERSINEPSPAKLELLAAALDWTIGDLSAGDPGKKKETSPYPFEGSSEDAARFEIRLGELFGAVSALDEKLDQALALLRRQPLQEESEAQDG